MTRAEATEVGKNGGTRKADAETLSVLALQGLFEGMGHGLSRIDTQGGLQDDRAVEIADLSNRLLSVAESFGDIIRSEDRPNNQLALYNLAYSSRFPHFLKQVEVENFFDSGSANRSVSFNCLTDAICAFRSKLLNLAAHDEVVDEAGQIKKINSTLTKYFTRQNLKMTVRSHYGLVLFFHIGLARQMGFGFDDCPVLNASPAVSHVFANGLVALHRVDATPETLLSEMEETLERGQARRDSTVFLGGLTEIGKADFRALWDPLFGESKAQHKQLSRGMSQHRHFLCYRLTSSIESVEVIKSFMVIQSPGRLIEEPHNWRKHFAVKIFTNYDTAMVRSVGAVLQLGDEVVAFASRREMQPEDHEMDRKPEWLDPTTFRGATMLAFGTRWFRNRRGILHGMLSTTNKERRNISSPILCIETDKTHSDTVGLDVIDRKDLVQDMLKYTRLKANEDAEKDKFSELLWTMLCSTHQDHIEWEMNSSGRPSFPPVMLRPHDPGSIKRHMDKLGYSLG